jgi:excisionase family DNA binding protein
VDSLLTERDVAAMFQVTPRTVRRWARAGELPCVRLGGVTRYPLPAIEALIFPTTREAAAGNHGSSKTAGAGDGHGQRTA